MANDRSGFFTIAHCGWQTLSSVLANTTWRQYPPAEFPPSGASAWGYDFYGLWAQLEIAEVPVLMRWIAPGRFQMGSPEDESEPERSDNERQHWVTLSEGYWLAETTCTQRLWEAVMGENPSRFKGAERPVETISWKDTQKYFLRVKAEYGVDLSLPTEAQWEYACRASTWTPFSQGLTIGTDQVNYNGNNPYGDAPEGEYRGETVAVKSFEPNRWGLYEMHGNVFEWCRDWYGEYEEGEQVDPVGPGAGADRVLRGGSWINDARNCRSARRYRNGPSDCDGGIGLRFAQVTGAPSRKAGAAAAGPGRSRISRGRAGDRSLISHSR